MIATPNMLLNHLHIGIALPQPLPMICLKDGAGEWHQYIDIACSRKELFPWLFATTVYFSATLAVNVSVSYGVQGRMFNFLFYSILFHNIGRSSGQHR